MSEPTYSELKAELSKLREREKFIYAENVRLRKLLAIIYGIASPNIIPTDPGIGQGEKIGR